MWWVSDMDLGCHNHFQTLRTLPFHCFLQTLTFDTCYKNKFKVWLLFVWYKEDIYWKFASLATGLQHQQQTTTKHLHDLCNIVDRTTSLAWVRAGEIFAWRDFYFLNCNKKFCVLSASLVDFLHALVSSQRLNSQQLPSDRYNASRSFV